MKHEFIVNPASGKRSHVKQAVERIREGCGRNGVNYAITLTECAGDAARIAKSIAQRGDEARVYAVGGDGTLCEVVQGAAGAEGVAVTNLPAGTGNDFLRMFGAHAKDAFWDLDELLQNPKQKAFDLIDCNGRLGLNVVCAGVDARVAADVDRFKALPLVRGKGAYILALAQNVLFKGIARDMRVQIGDAVWDQPTAILCICNGRYYGGGFLPVPDAMPDDGIFDVLLVPKVSLLTFARFVGDYSTGKYADYPELITAYHTGETILYESKEEITTVVDGEVMRAKRFAVKISEKKLNFFWPRSVSYQPENRRAAAVSVNET